MYLDAKEQLLLIDAVKRLELIDTSVFAESLNGIEAIRNLGIAQGILQSFLAKTDTSKNVESKD